MPGFPVTVDAQMEAGDSSAVDVVIPVYNAPELTSRCIDSIYHHIGHRLGDVYVHDNASEAPTATMLDSLRHPSLRVHHAPKNTGFGDAVNQGIAATRTPLVLVLNSDVEATNDFLGPLLETMEREPRLAAVTPGGNTYERYDFSRYAQRSGCVVTYNLSGYAFLIRREAFVQAGGFDPEFGLGFYEDTDLSRRLLRDRWWMGIHAGTDLKHVGHGSFRHVAELRELLNKNRRRYFERYAGARRQILLATGESRYTALPAGLREELEDVFVQGGEAYWASGHHPSSLSALQLHPTRPGLIPALNLFRTRQRKSFKQFTELWLTEDAPARYTKALGMLVRRSHLPVRRF